MKNKIPLLKRITVLLSPHATLNTVIPFTTCDISGPPDASVQSDYIKDVTHTF